MKLLRTLLESPVGSIFSSLGEKVLFPWPIRKLHFEGDHYANRAASKPYADGCNLIGFARAEFGIGQHLRNTAESCLAPVTRTGQSWRSTALLKLTWLFAICIRFRQQLQNLACC